MAGDWIKVELTLPEKPEVIGVAAALGITEDEVVGKLIRFWRWCDQHLTNCHATNVTFAFLDRLVGVTGFAQALVSVGWLELEDAGLVIPNFDRHLSKGSKTRALAIERKRRQREKSHDDDTELSRPERDQSVTREQRIENRYKPPPPTPSPKRRRGGGGGAEVEGDSGSGGGPEVEGGYRALGIELQSVGLADIPGALSAVRARGESEQAALAAVAEYRSSKPAYGPGALYWRLTRGTWPEPKGKNPLNGSSVEATCREYVEPIRKAKSSKGSGDGLGPWREVITESGKGTT